MSKLPKWVGQHVGRFQYCAVGYGEYDINDPDIQEDFKKAQKLLKALELAWEMSEFYGQKSKSASKRVFVCDGGQLARDFQRKVKELGEE